MSWIEVNMERQPLADGAVLCGSGGFARRLAAEVLPGAHPVLPNLLDIRETDLILWLLMLIDLSLAGNLLLIVIFSGFENFVSKMDVGETRG